MEERIYDTSKSHRVQLIDYIKNNRLAFYDEFSGKYFIKLEQHKIPVELDEYNKEDLKTALEQNIFKLNKQGDHIAVAISEMNFKSAIAGGAIMFNKVRNLLDTFYKWSEKDADYISIISNSIKLEDEDEREWFNLIFKKWIVASIGQMLGTDKNEIVFILSGKQGNGKTRFFSNLFKPFKGLWMSKNINPKNKDDMLALTENVFNIWDEMETMRKAESNDLKALVSEQDITERRPYASMNGKYRRICSFAGCTNDPKILKDVTGSRRFHIFITDKIDYNNKIDKNKVFAQALFLYKNKYKFWLTPDEIDVTNERGLSFSESNPIADAYLLAIKQSSLGIDEWLNAAEIISRINLLTGLKIPLNSQQYRLLSTGMNIIGVERRDYRKANQYKVNIHIHEQQEYNGEIKSFKQTEGAPF